ncbi:MAG: hypothetical protein ACSHYB_16645 [Roseibacillus sp.]
MKILAPLSLLLSLATSLLGAEPSTEEVFEELLARHQKLGSYFAAYEGKAPGGKTVTAAISYHGPSQMASVHTQFSIDGKIVAAPLQAITPQLGIVMSGQNALHLKDAPLILGPLAKVAGVLFGGKERPLGTWTPALSMTKDTMAAQLSISYQPQMPWLYRKLHADTTYVVDGDFIIFTTPDGCTSRVQSATGILQRQNFPNDEGDRTLVLKELQTDLSADEISTFINGYIPANLEAHSMRSHPLLANLQHQMFVEFVAFVEASRTSELQVSKRLEEAKPLLHDYFNALYPSDFWVRPDEEAAAHELRMEKVRSVVKSQWDANGLTPEGLHPTTMDGELAAELLTSTLKKEFLLFLENKTASQN